MLKDLYRNLFRSKFAKNIVLVAGGTAFAQTLGMVLSPIITRIYPPEEYGVLTVFGATLGLIAIAASLDYQKAIPIAEEDKHAINLLALSTIILVLFVVVTTLILTFHGEVILDIMDSEVLLNYKFLIPVGVFFAGVYNILLQWAFRKKNFKTITETKVNQSIFSNLIKILLGIFKVGPLGLIFGTIIGQSAGITTLSMQILNEKELIKKINKKEMANLAKRYVKFPLYSAPSNYVYAAGMQLPIIFLTSLFGSTVIGFFGLANSIVRMPMELIGTSVAQVFYAEAANIGKNNPQEIKRLSIKLTKKLAIIGLIPVLVIMLFGTVLFSFVFGSMWYEAGNYARVLSILVYFHFITMPVGRILEIFERQKEALLFNLLRLLFIFIVFGVAKFMVLNSYQTVALYTISSSVTYILLVIITQAVMDNEIKRKSK
jgi:O-antigen/teichoic acid export membrane protein